jgi:uncharacterized protein YaaR (DUF327 family)
MEHQEAKQLAQQLLDSEFESFSNNPAEYCRAMGWDKQSKGTHAAISKKDEVTFTVKDVEKLTSIIEKNPSEDYIEIAESNSVSDFLTNCVADKITDIIPALDIEGREIGIGDEVAYATVNKYKPVVKRVVVTGIDRWYVKMKKYSCSKGKTDQCVLIIKKGK